MRNKAGVLTLKSLVFTHLVYTGCEAGKEGASLSRLAPDS